jgi:hypothetical protein
MTYAAQTILSWQRRQSVQPDSAVHENIAIFQAKRAKQQNVPTSGYTMTQFGSNSEDSEEEQDVPILNVQHEERVRQALMAEYVTFRKQAIEFRRTLNVNSKKEERKAVCDWWKASKVDFPTLATVACMLFSVRISSASAERPFSYSGLVRTARRNKLGRLFSTLLSRLNSTIRFSNTIISSSVVHCHVLSS